MAGLRLQRAGSPTGLKRLLFRAPIPLFRIGLGFLFGTRFLMLEHVGRKSGETRRTVLEVVADHPDAVYVAAAWRAEAQWLKNVKANPNVVFYLGVKRFPGVAEPVSMTDAVDVLGEYAMAHPRALDRLAAFMLDEPGETSDEQVRRIVGSVPLVRLTKTH